MILKRALLTCCVLALPGALGGCVAAAIPVLAAGGIVAREARSDKVDNAVPPIVEVEPKAGAVPVAAMPTPTGKNAETGSAVAGAASGSATGTVFAARQVNPYAGFYLYASEKSRLDPVENPRNSAILATPGSLEPVTSECGILPPAVLVDLDPAGGLLDLAKPFSPNPELAEALAALRLEDVTVFWISGIPAIEAGKVRTQLLATGLDPWGRDGLLLMRRAEDRKDTRRRDLTQTHCVVAIAGDSKGDFDELFNYLRNPDAALRLDSLVGSGWFLTPTPIAAKEG